ncbi:uncharacterized protein IWZ02DRAFT_444214 [Phyllosticta citriasiana]|uniref:uncharacterized protein n=1 Tax=Phyllosticta citriasiana TaxID=595635 RepID=UPI0030FDBD3B
MTNVDAGVWVFGGGVGGGDGCGRRTGCRVALVLWLGQLFYVPTSLLFLILILILILILAVSKPAPHLSTASSLGFLVITPLHLSCQMATWCLRRDASADSHKPPPPSTSPLGLLPPTSHFHTLQ